MLRDNPPEWFMQRLQQYGMEVLPSLKLGDDTSTSDPGFSIVGVAKLTTEGMQVNDGPLTQWSDEAGLLMTAYCRPEDSFCVRVVDAIMLQEAIPAQSRMPHRRCCACCVLVVSKKQNNK